MGRSPRKRTASPPELLFGTRKKDVVDEQAVRRKQGRCVALFFLKEKHGTEAGRGHGRGAPMSRPSVSLDDEPT